MKKVIVIGGGIGGLTAAYRLLSQADVHLYETSSRLGGVIQTIQKDDFLLELGPDCFISENPSGIQLAKDLGLENELTGTIPEFRKSFIVKNGKLIGVPNDFYLMAPRAFWPFALTPLISIPGKLRALADLWIPKKQDSTDESLASFVKRRLGHELLERIAQPMIAGIYTSDPNQLSLQATMPRFLDWEKNYGSVIRGLRSQKKTKGTSGPRYGLFVTFKNGMRTLIEALEKKIPTHRIHLGHTVEKIEKNSPGWKVSFGNQKIETCDELILALPAHIVSRLVQNISPRMSEILASIPYASSGTINFGFKKDQISHPMNGVGFVIPSIEPSSLMAATFTHRKFEGRCKEGFAMIRAFIGGAMNEAILELDDSALIEKVYKDLQSLLGIKGEPIYAHIHRWKKSMPQYTVGHLDRVQKIEEEVQKFPSLHLVGNAYRSVGIPGAISSAEKCVNLIK